MSWTAALECAIFLQQRQSKRRIYLLFNPKDYPLAEETSKQRDVPQVCWDLQDLNFRTSWFVEHRFLVLVSTTWRKYANVGTVLRGIFWFSFQDLLGRLEEARTEADAATAGARAAEKRAQMLKRRLEKLEQLDHTGKETKRFGTTLAGVKESRLPFLDAFLTTILFKPRSDVA